MNPNDQADQANQNTVYARLAGELDIPEDKLRNSRNKWAAGQPAVSDKDRAAYAAFDAHPEVFGVRTQGTAALAKDRTTRGPGDFDENRQADPSQDGQTR